MDFTTIIQNFLNRALNPEPNYTQLILYVIEQQPLGGNTDLANISWKFRAALEKARKLMPLPLTEEIPLVNPELISIYEKMSAVATPNHLQALLASCELTLGGTFGSACSALRSKMEQKYKLAPILEIPYEPDPVNKKLLDSLNGESNPIFTRYFLAFLELHFPEHKTIFNSIRKDLEEIFSLNPID